MGVRSGGSAEAVLSSLTPAPAPLPLSSPSKVQFSGSHVRTRRPVQPGRGRLHHLRLSGTSREGWGGPWGWGPQGCSRASPHHPAGREGGGRIQPLLGGPRQDGWAGGWVRLWGQRVTCPLVPRAARWSAPLPPAPFWIARSTSGTWAPGSAASPAGTPRPPPVSPCWGAPGDRQGGTWGGGGRGRTPQLGAGREGCRGHLRMGRVGCGGCLGMGKVGGWEYLGTGRVGCRGQLGTGRARGTGGELDVGVRRDWQGIGGGAAQPWGLETGSGYRMGTAHVSSSARTCLSVHQEGEGLGVPVCPPRVRPSPRLLRG